LKNLIKIEIHNHYNSIQVDIMRKIVLLNNKACKHVFIKAQIVWAEDKMVKSKKEML